MASTERSNTLVEPSSVGSSGRLPVPDIDAPSPPRKRSTTALALASWSAVGAPEADGSCTWPGSDGAADAAAEGAGDGATGVAATPGAADLAGGNVQPAVAAAGVQAASVAATSPPPAAAPTASRLRRLIVSARSSAFTGPLAVHHCLTRAGSIRRHRPVDTFFLDVSFLRTRRVPATCRLARSLGTGRADRPRHRRRPAVSRVDRCGQGRPPSGNAVRSPRSTRAPWSTLGPVA